MLIKSIIIILIIENIQKKPQTTKNPILASSHLYHPLFSPLQNITEELLNCVPLLLTEQKLTVESLNLILRKILQQGMLKILHKENRLFLVDLTSNHLSLICSSLTAFLFFILPYKTDIAISTLPSTRNDIIL